MCTSRDIMREDCWTILRINTKWLFQPFYKKKVIKNTTSTKDTRFTQRMTENTTGHLSPYVWVVNKHYIDKPDGFFSPAVPF